MTRRVFAVLPILTLAACLGERSSPTAPNQSGPPVFTIQDGAHAGGGNPDFFFLPPMVPNPNGSPGWNGLGNSPNLSPRVEICETDGVSDATCNGAPTVFSGAAVSSSASGYQVSWKVPNSAVVYFRISVFIGSIRLGYADVQTGTAGQIKNVNTNELVPLKDGTTLPLSFAIQTHCTSHPCGEAIVNLNDENTIFIDEGGHHLGGVHIPDQLGTGENIVNISLSKCADLPLDIPLFGSCIHVGTIPEIGSENPLSIAAEVFVCDAEPPADNLPFEQHDQVTLHRKHDAAVEALPHGGDKCAPELLGQSSSIKGLVLALVHGQWKAARGQLFGLMAPTPLYARRLDAGAGGRTQEFSDFQFALPTSLVWCYNECPGPNSGVYARDVLGDPVMNAKVHFSRSSGGPVVVLTGATGFAASPLNALTAFGFGLASQCAFQGPYEGSFPDPFSPWDGEGFGGGPVTLYTSFIDVVNPTCGFSEGGF